VPCMFELGIDVLRVMFLTFVYRLQVTFKMEVENGVMSHRASCWLDSGSPSPEDFSQVDHDEVLV